METEIHDLHLFRLLAGALALALLVFAGERVLASFARRGRWTLVHRFWPLAGIVAFAFYVLFVLQQLFGVASPYFAGGLLFLILFGLYTVRHVLRDLFTGAVLRGEGALRVDRTVVAGEIRGRVRQIGLRSLVLVQADGRESRVPYGRLAGLPLTSFVDREAPGGHSFALSASGEQGVDATVRALREFLLLHPMVAPGREPEFKVLPAEDGSGGIQIQSTVHSYGARFGSEIEMDARRWLREWDEA